MVEETFLVSSSEGRLRVRQITPPTTAAPDAPVLVFLHEGLGSIEQWRGFPRDLAQRSGLRAVVFDRPGFGGSDPLSRPRDGRYLQREDLGSLEAVLEGCGIHSPILIGHSDGGTLALLYAATYPERPLGVVAEAAHVFVEEATVNGIRNTAYAYEQTDLQARLARYHGDKTDAMFRRWVDDWLAPEFSGWNIEACLSSIRCPLLVIQGEEDQYGSMDQVRAVATHTGGAVETFIIAGCGHVPHLEAGDATLEAMNRFIQARVANAPDCRNGGAVGGMGALRERSHKE